MKYGLSEEQLNEIVNIISAHSEIEEAVLFGSRAIDTYKEASDVDIALKGEKVTASLAAKLKFEIEEDTYLPFFFDFVAYPTITNEELKKHINRKGIVLYRRVGGEKCENIIRRGTMHRALLSKCGWKECKLGDVSSKIGSGATPTGGENAYKLDGISLIRSQNVYDFIFSNDGLAYIDEKQAYNLRNVEVLEDDILINITGESVTRCCIVPKQFLPARVNQHVSIIRPLKEKSDHQYIFYYLQSIKAELNSMAEIGCTRRALTKVMLENINILLPPLPEQRAIASVLSSLDDKIDLLHRQNKTLEAMAETLFRQWFVEEADEGWEEKPLSSIANFLNGLACQKFPPRNDFDMLPVLKIRELSSGISELSDWATTDVSQEYKVHAGDVIFAWSASLMVRVWDGGDCILNQHLFKVTSDQYPKWFYLSWCKHHLAEFITISASHATTMGHIKRGDLDTAMVLVPSTLELSTMSEQMTPLLEKQISNSNQIRTLEKMRDTLLPKLISGEVRVTL